MYRSLLLSTLIVFLAGCSCDCDQKRMALSVRIDSLSAALNSSNAHIDSLDVRTTIVPVDSTLLKYTWFGTGEFSHRIIDDRFYISSVSAKAEKNGYRISGMIGNACALDIDRPQIVCTINLSST